MEKSSRKLSRRDAIKVLGAAAGASVLANLPTKWSQPELATGVLPAHALTSVVHTLSCETLGQVVLTITSIVDIFPMTAGIPMNYNIALTGLDFSPAHASSGQVLTDAAGKATVTFSVAPSGLGAHTVNVQWSFVNPADGTASCSATRDILT